MLRWIAARHAALVAYLVVVTLAIVALGREANDVQERVVRIEQTSPCSRYGPESVACRDRLSDIVANLTARQACVIVESAGYECRARFHHRPPADPPLKPRVRAPGSPPEAGSPY